MTRRIFAIFLATVFVCGFMVSTTPLFSRVIVGEEVAELYETAHPYQGGNGVVWEQRFTWSGAGYIAIHFSNFDLAEGDFVEISSPNGRFIRRYEGKGKPVQDVRGHISDFWATHIPGGSAVVKLVSRNTNSSYGFIIDKWARGYEPEYIHELMSGLEDEALTDLEAICGADDKEWAKCYDGTTMYDKSKAVCRLLIQGTTACTGWLLGSGGHVMTNHHCIETADAAADTDYEFMAEGATCTTDCSSWGACPGVVAADAGTLVKTDVDLDYSLILLPTNVTGTYGYLQFRATLPTIGERIYIPQHPGAYGKQLAVNSDVDGPFGKVYSIDEPPCIGGPGDIGYYVDTAGGSSGSPVIAYNDNLVVSLHHCADCPNRGLPIPDIITHLDTDIPPDAIGTSIPQPPEAQFTADKTVVQIGSSVEFTDLSSYNPTSWSWTFEGGTPGTSTDQNPTVTYNTLGTFSVSLTVTNDLGSDTETKEDYIEVKEVVLDYCPSAGSTYTYEWIEEVQVGDFINTSGAAGYSDFTNLTIDLTAGETFDVLLTPGFSSYTYTEYWKIWIDYNIDGDFEDDGEEVFSGFGTTPISGNFTLPDDVKGETRMRVSMKWNDWPTPCETFSYGEVEDYTVDIKGIGVLFETGVLEQVASDWQTVTLQNNYVAPVVVCTVNYRTAEDPAVARVRNAAGNSFELMIQSPKGPEIIGGYNVHYVVVEEGVYNEAEHGIKMEALLAPARKTAGKGKWNRNKEKRRYKNRYTNPVVVGQVMTYNDPDWSVFWASSKNTKRPPDRKFYAGKHVGEDWDRTRKTETIGYIVMEEGPGLINNKVPFVAGVGPCIVEGYDNSSNGYLYTFDSIPTASTAIISAAGMNAKKGRDDDDDGDDGGECGGYGHGGDDGGWPVLLGLNPLTSTSIRLIYDEDIIKDAERLHGKERVAYIVFGTKE